jgi:hypothetical protein
MQPNSRTTEVPLLSDSHEITQKTQLHTRQRYLSGISLDIRLAVAEPRISAGCLFGGSSVPAALPEA